MSAVERNGNSQLWITVLVAVSAGLLVLIALGAAFFGVYVWPSLSKELFPVQFAEHEGFFPYGFGGSEEPLPAAVPAKTTLAIAPFASQSTEEDYQWLSYAFAYGTVSRLANFNELVIAGPEEIREELANEQSELTLSDITSLSAAQEAGKAVYADYVLIGNCAKSGDEIRVTAQIVEVATGNIHSERAGVREYAKIFDFHAELVRWVVEALELTTTSPSLERIKYKPTQSLSAYEYFGQGVMYYYRGEYEEAAAACQKALDIDSDFADAYIVLARALVCQEEYGEAIAQLKKAEELDPDRPYLHYYLGRTHWENEDYDQAVDELRQAVQRYPSDPYVRRWLGRAYHGWYRYDQAIVHYKEAIQLRPNWALPHWNIAGAYEHLGREDEEMAEYRETLRLSKRGQTVLKSKAYYCLGTTYLNNGQIEEAIAHLEKACELQPDFADARYNLACGYRARGQTDRAIAEYKKALGLYECRDNKARAHLGLGFTYNQIGRREEAARHYNTAAEMFNECLKEQRKRRARPIGSSRFKDYLDERWELEALEYRLSKAYGNLALVQGELGDYEAAIESADKALELNQDNAWAYFARGSAYSDKGEYERAITEYNRGLELCPKDRGDYVANLANRGDTYRELGEYDKALADVNQALKMDPNRGCAYAIRGNIYCDMQDYERARADADTALEKCPACPGGYVVRGLLHAKEQDYEQAIAEYEKALEVEAPCDKPYTYYRLAMVYKELGQLSVATEYIQKTLERLPEHKEAQELLAELENLAQ